MIIDNPVHTWLAAIGLTAALFLEPPALAVVPAPPVATPTTEAANLVAALERADRAAFVVDGDATFSVLGKKQFDALTLQLGSRLKRGYELSPLGELRQRGQQITLWRITFEDGGDDVLAMLSRKDGRVTGFWVN